MPWLVAALLAAGGSGAALAHAAPERADPPIDGVVAVAPERVEVWFGEEVAAGGTRLTVIGPGGGPERKHVTVSMQDGLGPGPYVVQWRSVSGGDRDTADGSFTFTVGAATPGGSPVASPVGSPGPTPTTTGAASSVAQAPQPTPDAVADVEGDFDTRAFAISVAAGVVAAIGIWLFWRLVRPRRPA